MSEQTQLSEEQVREAMLTPAEVQQKLSKLSQLQQLVEIGNRNKRKAEKAERKRVLKPKPKRRPKEFFTIISVAGVPVEGLEDAFTDFD